MTTKFPEKKTNQIDDSPEYKQNITKVFESNNLPRKSPGIETRWGRPGIGGGGMNGIPPLAPNGGGINGGNGRPINGGDADGSM